MAGLSIGLGFGLAFGLVVGFMGGPAIGLAAGLTAGIAVGLTLGPAAGFMYSMTWVASLAFAQLAVRRRTPVRLVRFLEDARDRNVLRTVGPVYQFRHARLQDRLASGPDCSLIGPDLGKLSAVKTCAGEVSAAEIGLGPCLGSSGRRATTESAPCRRC